MLDEETTILSFDGSEHTTATTQEPITIQEA
jgi:hypothetical protein